MDYDSVQQQVNYDRFRELCRDLLRAISAYGEPADVNLRFSPAEKLDILTDVAREEGLDGELADFLCAVDGLDPLAS